MNKKVFAFTVLLFSAASLFCSENFKFSLTPKFGFSNGQLGEYLFTKNTTDPDRNDVPIDHNQTSLLIWNFNPAVSLGFDAEFILAKHIFLSTSFSAGLPSYVGQMYDYDWFNHTNICQSRSISEERLTELYYTDVDCGYSFNVIPSLCITPVFGFTYKYIDFYADDSLGKINGYMDPDPGLKDPYGHYYDYDNEIISFDDERAEAFEATWITYWRSTELFWLGTYIDYSLNKNISFNCSFKFAPYISAKSEDNHPKTHVKKDGPQGIFLQDMPSGSLKAINIMLSSNFRLNDKLSVNIMFQWFNLNLITGPTYISNKPGILGGLDNENFIGDTQKDLTFSLGFKINLF